MLFIISLLHYLGGKMNIEDIVNSFEVIKDINDVMLENITDYLNSDKVKQGTAIFKQLRKENLIPFSFCGKDMYVESKYTTTENSFVDTIILEWGYLTLDHLALNCSNRTTALTDKFVLNTNGFITFNGNKKLSDYLWIEEYVQYTLMSLYFPQNN